MKLEKVEIPYIAGLRHLRTEQFVQLAAHYAANCITRAEVLLMRPLLKKRNRQCLVEHEGTIDGLDATIRGDDGSLAARVLLHYGKDGIPPLVNMSYIYRHNYREQKPRKHNYQSLSMLRDTYECQHSIRWGWRESIDNLAYLTLLAYGRFSNYVADQNMPPLAMASMKIDFIAPLPDEGVVRLEHAIKHYVRKERRWLQVSAKISSQKRRLASAEFACCEAPEIIGEIIRGG